MEWVVTGRPHVPRRVLNSLQEAAIIVGLEEKARCSVLGKYFDNRKGDFEWGEVGFELTTPATKSALLGVFCCSELPISANASIGWIDLVAPLSNR